MKLFVKLMMFLVVLALAGPFIMRGPDGRPLMSLKDLSIPDFSLPKSAPEELSGNEQEAYIAWSKDEGKPEGPKVYVIDPKSEAPIVAQAGVYYRWKDANGVWQFSNLPNPDSPNIVVETDPDANVLQSLSVDKIDAALGRVKEPEPGEADEESEEGGLNIPLPTTIPISQVPELMDQARAVQELVNKRTEMLNSNQF
jgi:hypothetical protein